MEGATASGEPHGAPSTFQPDAPEPTTQTNTNDTAKHTPDTRPDTIPRVRIEIFGEEGSLPHKLLSNLPTSWQRALILRWLDLKPHLQGIQAVVSLLPTSVRNRLPLVALAFLFSPRLFTYAAILGIAFGLGYLWSLSGVNDGSENTGIGKEPRADKLGLFNATVDGAVVPWQVDTQDIKAAPRTSSLSITVPPAIEESMGRLLDYIVRDFINNWYNGLNHSGSPEFPATVRTSLRLAIVQSGIEARRTNLTAAVLPIFRTLILHVREYRYYESLGCSLDEYIRQHPQSSYGHHLKKETTYAHLRNLSTLIVQSVLPKVDKQSPLVFSFCREIMATSVLLPMLETFSDPDWINQTIVARAHAAAAKAGESGLEVAQQGSPEKRTRTRSNHMPGAPPSDEFYVKVVEARNVPTHGMSGFYCVVLCGRDAQKTQKVSPESNPVWVEDFRFDWNSRSATKGGIAGIVIDLYDVGFMKDELVGSIYLPIHELPPNKYIREWYPLDTSESKIVETNTIELKIEALHISPDVDDDMMDTQSSKNITSQSSTASLPSNPSQLEIPQPVDNSSYVVPKRSSSHGPPPQLSISNSSTAHFKTSSVDPSTLTLRDVFQRSEALLEYMQYMDELGATAYVQLYVMIDSFKQFAAFADSPSSIRSDATVIYDMFFSEQAKYPLSAQVEADAPGLIKWVEDALKEDQPSASMFGPLQEKVLEIMEKRFFGGFKKSAHFARYLADVGGSPPQTALPPPPPEKSDEAQTALGDAPEGTEASLHSVAPIRARSSSLNKPDSEDSSAEHAVSSTASASTAKDASTVSIPTETTINTLSSNADEPTDILQVNGHKSSVPSLSYPTTPSSLQSVPHTASPSPSTNSNSSGSAPQNSSDDTSAPPPLPARRRRESGQSDTNSASGAVLVKDGSAHSTGASIRSELSARNEEAESDEAVKMRRTEDVQSSHSEANIHTRGLSMDGSLPSPSTPQPLSPTKNEHNGLVPDGTEVLSNSSIAALQQLTHAHHEGDGTQFLVTAISTLREQIMVIDSQLAKADGAKLKELMNTKLNLQTQVEQLVEIVSNAEEGGEKEHKGGKRYGDHQHVNLHDVRLSVFDATTNESAIFAGTGVFGGSTTRANKALAFVIQVESLDGKTGWMNTRSFADFSLLNEALCTQFPKVRKSNFPQKPKVPSTLASSSTSRADVGRRLREQLAFDLERWLNLLITDAMLCASPTLQEFLGPDSVVRPNDEDSKGSGDEIQRRVFGVFKSAGSVMKKVSTAAVKGSVALVDNVATTLDSAASATIEGIMDIGGLRSRESTDSQRSNSFDSVRAPHQRSASTRSMTTVFEKSNTATELSIAAPPRLVSRQMVTALESADRMSASASPLSPAYADEEYDDSVPLQHRKDQMLHEEHQNSSMDRSRLASDSNKSVHGHTKIDSPIHPNNTSRNHAEHDEEPPARPPRRPLETPPPVPPRAPDSSSTLKPLPAAPQQGTSSSATSSNHVMHHNQHHHQQMDGLRPQAQPSASFLDKEMLSEAELEIILEGCFGTIEEVFNLSDPNMWFRQKGLVVVKTLLRRAYGETISTWIQTKLAEAKGEEAVAGYFQKLADSLWPNGTFGAAAAADDGSGGGNRGPRTAEQKADTRIEAKRLFVQGAGGLIPVDALARVVGGYNCKVGLTRLFNMLQNQELNRHLTIMILDHLVRSVFGNAPPPAIH
ncbi:sorting nexin 13 [Quaeritorhiza haematococci]|nr:sorting nexin 13 [Quaeritorhiza haematococci]